MAEFTVAIVNPDDNSETLKPMKTWLRDNPEHYPFNPSEKNSRTIGKLGFPPRALCRRPFGIGHRTHAIHSAGPSRVPGGASRDRP